jgi:hypothetical protein
MGIRQLHRSFVKAAGRQRVGKQSRETLNKALSRALRDGLLEQSNEIGLAGIKEQILRKAGCSLIVVRPRSSREFVEIPASEIATVMLRLMRRDPALSFRALYRAVLDFYETKRMTANIEQRLRWIDERRDQLAESVELR